MRVSREPVLITIGLVLLGAGAATAQPRPTAASARDRLKAGNARYVRDASGDLPITAQKRLAQTAGQSPYAIVLSCADSRVPPEVVFNAGLGELFVVRTAGEVADKVVVASLEYAAEHLRSPLLVVMGHDSCGAVKTAIQCRLAEGPSMGPNLDSLVRAIQPAFARMQTPVDLEHLREAVLANVEQVVNDLLADSEILRHLVSAGRLEVVGGFYELATGRVRFSDAITAVPPAEKASGGQKH
jgi:carbonic anhydrase